MNNHPMNHPFETFTRDFHTFTAARETPGGADLERHTARGSLRGAHACVSVSQGPSRCPDFHGSPQPTNKQPMKAEKQTKNADNQPTNRLQPASIVSERLTWLIGRNVRVKLQTSKDGQSEDFTAIYEDCLPVGRGYFMVFVVKKKRRLVQSSYVTQLDEL